MFDQFVETNVDAGDTNTNRHFDAGHGSFDESLSLVYLVLALSTICHPLVGIPGEFLLFGSLGHARSNKGNLEHDRSTLFAVRNANNTRH